MLLAWSFGSGTVFAALAAKPAEIVKCQPFGGGRRVNVDQTRSLFGPARFREFSCGERGDIADP